MAFHAMDRGGSSSSLNQFQTGVQSEPFSDLLHLNTNAGYNGNQKSQPVFDFGNDDVLPNLDFQPIVDTSSKAKVEDHSYGSRHPPTNFRKTATTHEQNVPHSKDGVETATVAAVERTMKKYADNLLRVLEGMSGRLTDLETNCLRLEHSVDKIKAQAADYHGATDGKLRSLENMTREVQRGVQVLRDKQEIAEEHMQLAKLQLSCKVEAPTSASMPIREAIEAPPAPPAPVLSVKPVDILPQAPQIVSQQMQQQLPPQLTYQQSPNLQHQQLQTQAPPQEPQQQQQLPPHMTYQQAPQPQHQHLQLQAPPQEPQHQQLQGSPLPPQQQQVQLQGSTLPPHHQTLQMQGQAPPPQHQQVQIQGQPVPPQQQQVQNQGPQQSSQVQIPQQGSQGHQTPHLQQHQQVQLQPSPVSQPESQYQSQQLQPTPQQAPTALPMQMQPFYAHQQQQGPPPAAASMPQHFGNVNPEVNQYGPAQGNYSQDQPPTYMPVGYGPRPLPPPPSPPHMGQMPQQQAPANQHQQLGPSSSQMFEAPRTSGGQLALPAPYRGQSLPQGQNAPQMYDQFVPSQYRMPQAVTPSAPNGRSGGYPQLPTAQPVQRSQGGSNSGPSAGPQLSANRVPIEEVVENVASMGFPKEQVRGVVRTLTENGQSVDLNVVLDKLMNGGGSSDVQQPQKVWYNNR